MMLLVMITTIKQCQCNIEELLILTAIPSVCVTVAWHTTGVGVGLGRTKDSISLLDDTPPLETGLGVGDSAKNIH